jgi:hypothetical protein
MWWFETKKSFIYRVLIICFLLSIPLYLWPYHSGWIFGFTILPMRYWLNASGISFLAMKHKKKGAVILAVGAVNFLIFYLSFFMQPTISFLQNI